MVKYPPATAGDLGSIPMSGRSPREGTGNPLQHSCLEDHHGQRSLVDYSPWGHRELDTAKQLSTHALANREIEGKRHHRISKSTFYLHDCIGK